MHLKMPPFSPPTTNRDLSSGDMHRQVAGERQGEDTGTHQQQCSTSQRARNTGYLQLLLISLSLLPHHGEMTVGEWQTLTQCETHAEGADSFPACSVAIATPSHPSLMKVSTGKGSKEERGREGGRERGMKRWREGGNEGMRGEKGAMNTGS